MRLSYTALACHTCCALIVAMLGAMPAQAADEAFNTAMNYVSLDAQQDNADTRQLSATLSMGLGNSFWIQGTGGQISESGADTTTLGDLRQVGGGVGFNLEHVQTGVTLTQTRNDEAYRQQDLNANIDWVADRFGLGLDLMHRRTDNSLDTVRDFPSLSLSNVTLHVDEAITGNGYGLHASFNFNEAWSLAVGAMQYNYDSDYELTSSSNPILIRRLLAKHPTLSRIVYLNNSGVTRSLALLDSSVNLGVSYQFDAAALSLTWFHDEALDNGGGTDTFMVGANVLLGDHWTLSPLLGRSSSEQSDAVTFGGLSVSYNW